MQVNTILKIIKGNFNMFNCFTLSSVHYSNYQLS